MINEGLPIRDAFLLMMEERMVLGGSNASLGRILGLVMIENRPMDQKELADLSGYTKAHVSKVLSQLLLIGMIQKSFVVSSTPGRPRLIYSLDKKGYDILQPGILIYIRNLNHTKRRLLEIKDGTFEGNTLQINEQDSHIIDIVELYINYITKMVAILEDALEKVNL